MAAAARAAAEMAVSLDPGGAADRDLAHEMQTAGELAGLEGTISLWRT